MPVKRGHMVSKGYLRAWADDRNRVEVLDVQHGRGFLTTVGDATVVSYAYDPRVLTRDLEGDYARIENGGISAINKLRGGRELTEAEATAVVGFLDMHLDRGRYADQAEIFTPAMLLMEDGQVKDATLGLGDRILLSQSLPDVTRLANLSLEQRKWQVYEAGALATGDGAVLLWAPTEGADISTITFPLSPTQLLVIGQDPPNGIDPNLLVAQKSRRWVVGYPGSLRLTQAAAIAEMRRQAGATDPEVK